ncbi:MAG: RNA polymerase sigma factor [Burkholderiales bacterium]|nr:RNA polymerase sigma factor [Burkholderiales bacterium]
MSATPASTSSSAALSDAQLVLDVARGNVKAFEQLMRRHNQTLFRTARAILHNDAEAEDALQESYLRAYRSIGAYRGEARVSTWLVRIVVNEALARLRKNSRRAAVVPIHGGTIEHEEEYDMEAVQNDHDSPQELVERGEIRRLLEQKIDALPEGFRVVFVLRALEELSVEETAAVLGVPEATVRSRFFRARSQLREALSKEIDLALGDAFAFLGERCDRVVARVLAKLAEGGTTDL